MITGSYRVQHYKQRGFTLLELMVSILVLMIVMGAVFSQVTNVQKTAKTDSMKLDLTQESREFVDQFSRYPYVWLSHFKAVSNRMGQHKSVCRGGIGKGVSYPITV